MEFDISTLPKELISLVLDFRRDFYIHEKLQECIHYYKLYNKLYIYFFSIFHNYEMFIDLNLLKILSYKLDYNELLRSFSTLGGFNNEFIFLNNSCSKLNSKIKKLLNFEFILSSNRLLNYFTNNPHNLKIEDVLRFNDILVSEIIHIQNLGDFIIDYKNKKTYQIQYILNYILYHISQWKFRVKWLFYQNNIHKNVVTVFQEKQRLIYQFLQITI